MVAKGVLFIVLVCAAPIMGGWLRIRTWREQFSTYETGGIWSRMFGENALHGYDSGFPVLVTIAGLGLAVLSLPIGLESTGYAGVEDAAVTQVLRRTCQVFLLLGSLTSWSPTSPRSTGTAS